MCIHYLRTAKQASQLFAFYCVVTIHTVGYVCSFCGDQIFVDFVSFLSTIIYKVLHI